MLTELINLRSLLAPNGVVERCFAAAALRFRNNQALYSASKGSFGIPDRPSAALTRFAGTQFNSQWRALLRKARFSSRWAHAVREPPVLPGLNRHWPDTLANGAMAHMSTLVFFAGYDGFRSTSPRRTLISRLWNRDLCSRSGLRAPRSVIEIRRCVPTSD
jgi:hypothetical protein